MKPPESARCRILRLVSDLIDTTEMYLKAIYELQEEGTVPLRARIAERLRQSGPTVSQTVARMERDGLVSVQGDRHLQLSETGTRLATRVMRKHRLAERLLTDVIGLEWELVHDEACRWVHVMSEQVESRLLPLLGNPTHSPYGTPIPGLDELGQPGATPDFRAGVVTLAQRLTDTTGTVQVTVRRIGEPLQTEPELLKALAAAGAGPDGSVPAEATPDGFVLGTGAAAVAVDRQEAAHIYVDATD
jgi:DtxR family Mn-dependent transcriptional regulator